PDSPYTGTKIKVGTPTTIHGVLEFHNGAVITIGASWDVASHGHHNIELYGVDGTIYVPDPNFFGGELVTTDVSGKKTTEEPWDHPFGKANQTGGDGTQRANYRTAGLAHMMQSIEEGRPARCGLDVALYAVDVMTSLLKAAEQGQVLTLSTTCERPAALGPTEASALLKDAGYQGRAPLPRAGLLPRARGPRAEGRMRGDRHEPGRRAGAELRADASARLDSSCPPVKPP